MLKKRITLLIVGSNENTLAIFFNLKSYNNSRAMKTKKGRKQLHLKKKYSKDRFFQTNQLLIIWKHAIFFTSLEFNRVHGATCVYNKMHVCIDLSLWKKKSQGGKENYERIGLGLPWYCRILQKNCILSCKPRIM